MDSLKGTQSKFEAKGGTSGIIETFELVDDDIWLSTH